MSHSGRGGTSCDNDKGERYKRVKKLGEGTYAVVYEAIDTKTNEKVAIKKIKISKAGAGLDISAIRELALLRPLQHQNIARFHDTFITKQNLNLVLDCYEGDLEIMIKDASVPFTSAHVKSWMLMLLRGLLYCHQRNMIHRDIKPNNLLIAEDGQIKIADFGLARYWGLSNLTMTSQVVTRWYRAPELLLGSTLYGEGVDIWAAGCIFAELMLRHPFMPGDTDIGQLDVIFDALGTPTDWPLMRELPNFVVFCPKPAPLLSSIFTAASKDALDLLGKMLTFDPLKRISAKDALLHPFFSNDPPPTDPRDLPPPPDVEAFNRRKLEHERSEKYKMGSIQPKKLEFE